MQSDQRVRDYILEEKIGEGGMGEVWKARHALLPRQVAIKIMTRQLATDPKFEDRFIKEAQAQATLQHPRILGVTEFFSEDSVYYLVMPLVTGESLAQRMDRNPGPLPVEDALAITRDLLDALDYAHQKGIIHRDVKPSNIMLDHGHAYLMDFGIAISLGQQRLTRTGTSLGTPHYISPEQIRNAKSLDHRADVYSAGCVLYEMLAGRPPFTVESEEGDTDFALKEAHMYQAPPSLRTWNPAVPPALDRVVLQALEKDPDNRYGGCGEFRRALETWDRPGAALDTRPATPVPSPAGSPQWFYTKNNQQLGPLAETELRRLIAAGQLLLTDYVWNQSLPAWRRVGDIPSLIPTGVTPPPILSPGPQPILPLPVSSFVQPVVAQTEYATFGARFGACLLDTFILMIVQWGLLSLVDKDASGQEAAMILLAISLGLPWLYFSLFESSTRMATLGKRAAGLRVTDLEGRRIGFGRATGRWLSKIPSGLLLGLGYFAALSSPKRQAWHDSIAGTVVLKVR